MGLTGWSDSNYLSRSALVGAEPFFVAIWCNVATAATFRNVYGQGPVNSGDNYRQIFLYDSNLGAVESYDGVGDGQAIDGSSHPSSTWFLFCGAFISSTSRSVWVDNHTRVDDTTSANPSGGANSMIGRAPNDGIPFTSGGGIAELSIWNASGMTLANLDSLVAKLRSTGTGGQNPINIKNEAGQPWSGKLTAYIPMTNTSDINDTSGNTNNFSMSGTLTNFASHPTIDAVASGATSINVNLTPDRLDRRLVWP